MPEQLAQPGVYIEEIPSGVHTVTGVATSVAAFVGRAARGSVDQPVTVTGFDGFVREFGGLWAGSLLGFAVRDFFLNGGGQAVICRLYHPADGSGHARLTFGGGARQVALKAVSPGAWGNGLRARVDLTGAPPGELFTLVVLDQGTGRTERYAGVSLYSDHPRCVRTVLERESSLVRWAVDPLAPPPPGGTRVRPDASATAGAWQDAAGQADAEVAAAAAALKEALAGYARVSADASDASADPAQAAGARDERAADEQTAEEQATAGAAVDGLRTALANEKAKAAAAAAGLGGADSADLPDTEEVIGQYERLLDRADLFNLLCIPPYRLSGADVEPVVFDRAAAYCRRRRAVLLVDPPSGWTTAEAARTGFRAEADQLGGRGPNAAVYFPRLRQPNPFKADALDSFVPCGAVAGVLARTDGVRGVWKAAAGLEAGLVGVSDLSVRLSDGENGVLNPLGVNCLRSFPVVGRVVWGARTLAGADVLASEWKYLPVRRLALFVEESLFRGTQWVVFEPNGESLWAEVRLNVGAFMQQLFRQGALQGRSPREAYFVKCDAETTTQADRDLGVVNIRVGFAPLKPAEFVVVQVQQLSEQLPS
ncbi:phage tail sheath C-terminal domain-containing protein [Kitasatospora sp. NPDC058170]|uniref:phage tail sheath family protein n=1 Tax=Kitasatospora sp. NPDC058170 TaxID=3346364 RepID=UPI0036DF02A5